MSNIIDSIQLSGTSYTLQDSEASRTVELTQAEYDALTTKDPNVFYIITDAQAGDLTNYYTKTETNTLLGGLSLVKLTQSEYDSLATKDNSTLYVIVN